VTAMDNLVSGLGLMFGVPLFILAADAVEKRLVEWWQCRQSTQPQPDAFIPAQRGGERRAS
jgi:hypothetical protein